MRLRTRFTVLLGGLLLTMLWLLPAGPAAAAGPQPAPASATLEVNQASEAQLDGLIGIGPVISGRILAARRAKTFDDWGDFLGRVKGMGPATAARLSEQGLRVQGQAWPGPAAPPRR